MANLIFAFCLHVAVFSFTHFCIVSLSSFFSFSYFIIRNTSGLLKHWRKHRMLVTNTAPCSWNIPPYSCHWAIQTWVRIRKVPHKDIIWVSLLQVKLTLDLHVMKLHQQQFHLPEDKDQNIHYWSKKSISILHFSSLNLYKKYIKNHASIYSPFHSDNFAWIISRKKYNKLNQNA